jgi:hypothetical protein
MLISKMSNLSFEVLLNLLVDDNGIVTIGKRDENGNAVLEVCQTVICQNCGENWPEPDINVCSKICHRCIQSISRCDICHTWQRNVLLEDGSTLPNCDCKPKTYTILSGVDYCTYCSNIAQKELRCYDDKNGNRVLYVCAEHANLSGKNLRVSCVYCDYDLADDFDTCGEWLCNFCLYQQDPSDEPEEPEEEPEEEQDDPSNLEVLQLVKQRNGKTFWTWVSQSTGEQVEQFEQCIDCDEIGDDLEIGFDGFHHCQRCMAYNEYNDALCTVFSEKAREAYAKFTIVARKEIARQMENQLKYPEYFDLYQKTIDGFLRRLDKLNPNSKLVAEPSCLRIKKIEDASSD